MVFYTRHPLAEKIFGAPKPASKPTYFPEFSSGVVDPPSPKSTYFPEFEEAPPVPSEPAGVRGLLGEGSSGFRRGYVDPALGMAVGMIGAGEGVVGIADIIANLATLGKSGGAIGNFLEEKFGYDPETAQAAIREYYSPELKSNLKTNAETKGFLPSAAAYLKSPSTIIQAAAESAPSMIGGGGIKDLALKGAPRLMARIAPKSAPLLAAAIGEGAFSSGSGAEQTRQATGGLTPKQTALHIAAGAGTGLINRLSGGIADRLGIADPDTLSMGSSRGLLSRLAGGAVTEGSEELLQSGQEQGLQNVALNRPWAEGVPEAAASGALTGAAMGAGFNIPGPLRGTAAPQVKDPTDPAGPEDPVSDDPVEILKALARGGARPVPATLQPAPAVPTAPAEFAQDDLEGAAQLPRTVSPSLEAASSKELASAVSPGSARSIAEATRARHAEAKRRAAAFRPATPAEAEQYQADAVMALQDALTRGADDEAVVTYVLDSVALGEKRGGFNTPEAALKAAGFARPKPIVEALKAKHGAGVFDVAREEKVSEVKQAEALDKAAKKQKTAEDIYYANPAVQERITASQYANILEKAVAAKSMKPLVDEAGLSPAKAADALALGTREESGKSDRTPENARIDAGLEGQPEVVAGSLPSPLPGISVAGDGGQVGEVGQKTRSVAERVNPVLRAEQVLPAGETEAVVGSGRSDVVPPQVRGRVPDGGEGGDVQGESVSDSAVADYRARIDQRIREIKRKEPNLPHRIIAQRVNQEFGTDNRLGKGREALGRRIVDEVLKGQENPKTTDRGNYPGGPVAAMVNSQKDTGPENDPERNLYQPDDPFAAAREANQPEVDAGFTRAEAWLRQKFGVPETLPEPQNDPRFGNAEPKQVTEADLENAVLDARRKRVQGQPAVAPANETALLEGRKAGEGANRPEINQAAPDVSGEETVPLKRPVADQAAQGAESVPQRLKVQAKNLQPGDVARGSGETILAVAKQFVAKDETQRGKVEVQLRSSKGKVRTAYWNPSTEISVDRVAPQAQAPTSARPERRGDTEMRAAVSSEQAKDTGESTREIIDRLTKERDQARTERDTDVLTGLGSRRAADVDLPNAKVISTSDMAGMGFMNENPKWGSYPNGDVAIAAIGKAYLKAAKNLPGLKLFRIGGDEFEVHAQTQAALDKFIARAEALFSKTVLTFKQKDGSLIRYVGAKLDHGTGKNRGESEAQLKLGRAAQVAAGARSGKGQQPHGLLELSRNTARRKSADRGQRTQRVEKPYPGLEGLDATQTAALEFDAQKLKRELPNVEESTGRPTLWDVIEPFYFNDLYGYVGRNTLDELTEAHLPAAERSPRARLIAQKALPGGRPSARLKPHEIGLTKDGRLKSEASVPKLGTVYKTKGALDEQIRTLIDLGWFRDGSTAGDLAEALIADRPFYHPDGADSESKVISAEDSQLKEAAQAVAEETGIKAKDIVPILIDNNGNPKEIAILKALVKLDPFGTQEQAERAAQDGDFMDAQEPAAPAADEAPNPWDEPVVEEPSFLKAQTAPKSGPAQKALNVETTTGGEQQMMLPGGVAFGSNVERKRTEGREALGPLFQQEAEAEKKADAARQRSIVDEAGTKAVPVSQLKKGMAVEGFYRGIPIKGTILAFESDQSGYASARDEGRMAIRLSEPIEGPAIGPRNVGDYVYLDLNRGDYAAAEDNGKPYSVITQIATIDEAADEDEKPKRGDAVRQDQIGTGQGESAAPVKAKEAPKLEAKASIQDAGEKFGGARKDIAKPLGPRAEKAEEEDEERPWAKRFTVSQNQKTGKWDILDLGKGKQRGAMRFVREIASFDTKEQAEAFVPIAAVGVAHRAYKGGDGRFKIERAIGDRKLVQVIKETFETREEAMAYMAAHAEEILEIRTNFGEEVLPRPDPNNVQRIGAARREGDVDENHFKDTFGFRGVEFGNWNAQDERQTVMNHAYDSLLDLAETLGIPPKAISLNGDLGLAFGSRGHGLTGAMAHYERDYGVINLTKLKGAGALAHEWFHSLDHYFGRQRAKDPNERVENKRGDRVFKEASMVTDGGYTKGVREEVAAKIKTLVSTMKDKAEKFVEDTQKVERWVGQTRDDLKQRLDSLRNNLAATNTYSKNKKAPATAEQLARFDALAEQIINGEAITMEAKYSGPVGGRRGLGTVRWTNAALEEMSAILKSVRGYSGFAKDTGPLTQLYSYIKRYAERIEQAKSAATGEEKTKSVPTQFAMNARSADQGRVKGYWSTPVEMAARAFQSYVEDRLSSAGAQNDFLTFGTKNAVIVTPWGFVRPYPLGDERAALNAAFDDLFKTIQTKETDKGVAMFATAPKTTFFSQLERAAAQAKQPMKGADMLRFLSTREGVKAAEIKWTGLDDFLRGKAEARVTPAEIQEFLKANKVTVTEVTKGDTSGGRTLAEVQAAMEELDRETEAGDVPDDEWVRRTRELGEEQDRARKISSTKFAQYQLPGGQNYKELLLTLPERKGAIGAKFQARETIRGHEVYNRDTGEMVERVATPQEAVARANEYNSANPNTPISNPNFQSGHFPEPNILAHVRFNERTDANGRRVLFLEEIQSDWAQKGRREGFKGPEGEMPAGYTLIDENEAARESGLDVRADATQWWSYKGPGMSSRMFKTREEAIADARRDSRVGKDAETPLAPFVEKTEDWTALALKSVLHYAAANGFDSVAWTPGSVQNERYDLSKQVKGIEYQKNADGTYYLSADLHNGGNEQFGDAISESKLEDYVGKEVAQKIVAGEGAPIRNTGIRQLSGLDLKVGGEGMKAFYDRIVPQVAEKIGKKFGAKVGTTEIAPGLTTQSLPVTPEMRASATSEGFPLFAADKAKPSKPITLQIVKNAIPGLPWKQNEDGSFTAKMADGRTLRLQPNANMLDIVEGNRGAFEESARAGGNVDAVPVGAYSPFGISAEALISIAEASPGGTIEHEGLHFLWDVALHPKEKAALVKKFGGEEESAYAFAKWLTDRNRKPVGLFQKVRDFVRRLVHYFRPTWESTFGEAASGRAARRVVGESTGGERFAAAWHGSPHKFDRFRFDGSTVGTGEGAQAYGHGLYFAESPEVGKQYADKLAPARNLSKKLGWSFDEKETEPGNLYHVDIPDSVVDRMLDWDRPLSEQPENVKRALYNRPGGPLSKYTDHAAAKFEDVDWKRLNFLSGSGVTGENLYRRAVDHFGSAEKASEYFHRVLGVPGIKYLDGSSRSKGEGSRNFVVFDDKDVTILTRNGEKVGGSEKAEAIQDLQAQHPETAGSAKFATAEKIPPGDPRRDENFRKWFAGSKVVDADGKPLVVYHGTASKDFSKFEGYEGVGWFTENAEQAAEYRRYGEDDDGEQHRVMPVLLSIKKPLVLSFDMDDGMKTGQVYEKAGLTPPSNARLGYDGYVWETVNDEAFLKAAERAGFDGISVKEDGNRTWSVFKQGQVKSAIGNRGTFDPKNPDIRFSTAPKEEPKESFNGIRGMDSIRKPEREIKKRLGPVLKALPGAEADLLTGLYDRFTADGDVQTTWETIDKDALATLGVYTKARFLKLKEKGIDIDVPGFRAAVRMVGEAQATNNSTRRTLEAAGPVDPRSREYRAHVASSAKLAGWIMALNGDQTGAAQAFAVAESALSAKDNAAAALETAFGEIGGLGKDEAARLVQMAKTDPQHLATVMEAAFKPGFSEKLNEWRKGAMLFSIRTYGVNFFGNAMKQAVSIAEIPVAAATDKMTNKGDRQVYLGEMAAARAGLADFGREAFRDFLTESWAGLRGVETFDKDGHRPYEQRTPAISGPVGKFIRTPFRMLQAADNFFKETAKAQSLYREAYRRGRTQGLTGDALWKKVDDLISIGKESEWTDPRVSGMMAKATKDAQYETFTLQANYDNAGAFGALADFLGKFEKKVPILGPVAGLALPFKNTPANIAWQSFERSPFGFKVARNQALALRSLYKDLAAAPVEEKADIQAKIDAKQRDLSNQVSRATLGTVLFALGTALAAAGLLTGSGPPDWEKKRVWEEEGNLANAINLGGTWYGYDRFEPIAAALSIAGNTPTVASAEGFEDKAAAFAAAMKDAWISKTYFQGLEDFADLVKDPQRYGSSFLRDIEGSFVPAFMGQTVEDFDPIVRDRKANALAPITSKIPGLSQNLPPVHTGRGDFAKRVERAGQGLVPAALNPFGGIRAKSTTGDPLAAEMTKAGYASRAHANYLEIGVGPTGAKRKERIDLTEPEREMFRKADQSVSERMRQSIESAGWKNLTPDQKLAAFRRNYDRASNSVRDSILPAVHSRLREKLAERKRAN